MKPRTIGAIKVGIIGAGRIFKYQYQALSQSDQVDFVCVCDIDTDKMAGYDHLRCYHDVDDLLSSETFDVVIVSVPVQHHYEIAKLVLDKGVGVVLEKPATLEIHQFRELMDMAKQRGLFFYVSIHAAFAEDVLWFLKQYSGCLKNKWGEVITVDGKFYDPYIVGNTLVPHAHSLGGSWVDSGINGISVAKHFVDWRNMTVEEAAFTRIPLFGCSEIQAAVQYRFPLESQSISGFVRIDTNWALNVDLKITKIGFEKQGLHVLLDHSAQTVKKIEGQHPVEILADFSDKGDRLTNHYINMFGDCLAHYRQGTDNLDEVYHLHKLLYQPNSINNGIPVYRDQ